MIDDKIDIKQLAVKLISKWYYFLICVLLTMGAAYLYAKFANPTYRIRASIRLDNSAEKGGNSEKFLKGMELLKPQTLAEDEIGILQSLSLVESTLQKLNFGISYFKKWNLLKQEVYGDGYPYVIELDSTVDQIVNVPITVIRTSDNTYSIRAEGENVGTYNFKADAQGQTVSKIDIYSSHFADKPVDLENLGFKIHFNKPFRRVGSETYFFVIHDLGSLARSYQSRLEIKRITRESNIVEINLQGSVPRKEILFLNSMLNVYLINELNNRQQLGLKTIEFIDKQLKDVSDELQQAEGSLESFRSQNNIINLSATAENLMENIDKLEQDKSELEVKLKYYKYIAEALGKGDDIKHLAIPSTFGIEDPLLNNLLLDLSKLSQERTALTYSTREGNPVSEVSDLKIANTKKVIVENVTNFIDASTAALSDANRRINQLKGKANRLPRSERELVGIQRKFEFNDNVYNYLLEKRAEAGIAIASNSMEKTIVDRAQIVGNGPVSPNRKLLLLGALIFAIGSAAGLIIIKDFVSDNIVTTEDVEKITPIPFIGSIAHGRKRERNSSIVAHTRTELGESFRSLRVNLQYLALEQGDDQVIGVTSSATNEGKTFCSINLAAAIVLSGRRTVLIDADMRRPNVARTFGAKAKFGLSNYLTGGCSFDEIIKPTPLRGLDIIPSGPIPPNPIELIGSEKMDQLIRGMKQQYDTVVIDSPPFGYVAEYIILMKYTDANIYVVRSNLTSRNQLQKINRLYKEKKIRNVRIVLNDVKTSSYGHYYAYR